MLAAALGPALSHAEESVTARIRQPVISGDRVVIPAGSSVYGRVGEAVPAKQGLGDKAGSLSLSFDRVEVPGGSGAPISAAMARVGPRSGEKTAGIIAASAAGGAILGKVQGGNTKSAALGSVVGGAIGTGVAAGTSGKDVVLPAGESLTIQMDQALTLSIKP